MDRVVFYGKNDILFGNNIGKIETLDVKPYNSLSINDAIEYYNIYLYFKDNVSSNVWSCEQIEGFRKKSQKMHSICMQYFNSISDNNIINLYPQIENYYIDCFWSLFATCKLYNRISKSVFNQLMHGDKIPPHDIFSYKQIVSSYGKELRDYILEYDSCIRIVLSIYEQQYIDRKKVYLPEEFTQSDLDSYLIHYISGEHVNVNTLETISQISKIGSFNISPEIRLKSRKRYEQEVRKLSQNGIKINFGVNVSFSPKIDGIVEAGFENGVVHLSYDSKFILDNLDDFSIIRNYILLFGYCDNSQVRCKFVSTKNQRGAIEKLFGANRTDLYPVGVRFQTLEMMSQAQMTGYYDLLRSNNVYLEDSIKWFFSEHLRNQYKCPALMIQIPAPETSFYEKCVLLCGLLDSVTKQIDMFINEREINQELLNLTSNVVKYKDIPSFLPNKYIYAIENPFDTISGLIFSDQSQISFVHRLVDAGKHYDTFEDLINQEEIYIQDFYDYAKPSVQLLKEHNLIKITDDGKITWGNSALITIIKDLYQNDVINRYHYPVEYQAIFDELIEEKILQQSSSLLSTNESKYFDYVLNKSEYVNGLDLRNKYVHGSQMGLEESVHKNNYMILLRLMIVLILKIDDDFSLAKKEGILNDT